MEIICGSSGAGLDTTLGFTGFQGVRDAHVSSFDYGSERIINIAEQCFEIGMGYVKSTETKVGIICVNIFFWSWSLENDVDTRLTVK